MRRISLITCLSLTACGLGEPSFYLGETEVYNYTSYADGDLWIDLPEAWEEMQKTHAPKSTFDTTILVWELDSDSLDHKYWGMYTHWENEIELRHTYRGSVTWRSSLAHELAHRWNKLSCDGDCSSHGAEFQKKFKTLQNAARRTDWAVRCYKLEGFDLDPCFHPSNRY